MEIKRRGRPPKHAKEAEQARVEVGYSKRPSAFDLGRFGIKKDPSKDYRWADPNRVDEHKNLHGYKIRQAREGETKDESGHTRTKGRMVLMERDINLARESKARKALRTEAQIRNVKDLRREDVERLSRKHGIDLHKHFLNKLEKIENERGG